LSITQDALWSDHRVFAIFLANNDKNSISLATNEKKSFSQYHLKSTFYYCQVVGDTSAIWRDGGILFSIVVP